jgi:hypothetical protein
MKEALLGLAYLDLEDGDTAKALDRVNQLKKTDPTDPEVVALDKQIRRARASWIQIGWDGSTDSDDNKMNTYRAEGGFAIPAHMDLRFGYAHSDLHGPAFDNTAPPPVLVNPDANSSADTLYGALGWQPKARHRGELRLGVMSLSDSTGGERTTGIGAVPYAFPMAHGMDASGRQIRSIRPKSWMTKSTSRRSRLAPPASPRRAFRSKPTPVTAISPMATDAGTPTPELGTSGNGPGAR